MKVEFKEHRGCFAVNLEPETAEEVVSLVRLGMNSTKELRSCYTDVFEDGSAGSSIVVGKRKQDFITVRKS